MFFSRRSRQTIQWLLVFLGNPGDRFDNTRHNIGYHTCDVLADRVKKRVQRVKFKSWVADFDYGGVRVLAMKPTTYMNLSGEAVREAAAFYKIPPERILVICDDISLPTGKLRLRRSGSAGGHNGLKSIIAQLHSDQFPRLKMGVGQKPHPAGGRPGHPTGRGRGGPVPHRVPLYEPHRSAGRGHPVPGVPAGV